MSRLVTVCEFARLTTDVVESNLGQATVSSADFDWLCKVSAGFSKEGARLIELESRRWLRLDNYVGVLETPSGTRIEILPKHVSKEEDVAAHRKLLLRILSRIMDVSFRDGGMSEISLLEWPLTEWIISRFLSELDSLVKRGLRFDYRTVREESRFLRGRLDISKQLRQSPGRAHWFHIEHEVFEPDCVENRLLKSALRVVRRSAQSPANWALAQELWQYMEVIHESVSFAEDFRSWRESRLMAHYRSVRPWCQLILEERLPVAQVGDWDGISLLFPMEVLFERFVANCMQSRMSSGVELLPQRPRRSLCTHKSEEWFKLKPDLVVRFKENIVAVLDTKWKKVDQQLANASDKYLLKESDFYQVFVYGEKYLSGDGDLFLVYPRYKQFESPLPVFEFKPGRRLWIVPFDLELEELVTGEWVDFADWLKVRKLDFNVA